jgi:hypothetical protein
MISSVKMVLIDRNPAIHMKFTNIGTPEVTNYRIDKKTHKISLTNLWITEPHNSHNKHSRVKVGFLTVHRPGTLIQMG